MGTSKSKVIVLSEAKAKQVVETAEQQAANALVI